MRLQVIDPRINFECNGCTACCTQPWRVAVEADKLAALQQVDWAAAYPELEGRELYRTVRSGRATIHELGKKEDHRCVFLDHDGLCMIHKQLGYDAKPRMCKQFPFFPAIAWDADYVSANFGCRAIQRKIGPPVLEQNEQLARTVAVSANAVKDHAKVPLTGTHLVSQAAAKMLRERLVEAFADRDGAFIVDQLADALALLEMALATAPDSLATALANGQLAVPAGLSPREPFPSACHAPMQSRFLFAATLFPDTLPPDSTMDMGFLRRMSLVPKLMTLARMQGVYASRLLGRNVAVHEIMDRPADMVLTPAASRLLARYLQSRIWQQFPAGTRLPVLAGVHQHILDVNAVLFYARGLCEEKDELRADLPTIERALTLVEFHLANQNRVHAQVLRKWFRTALETPALAWCSLRMIRCRRATEMARG